MLQPYSLHHRQSATLALMNALQQVTMPKLLPLQILMNASM
jgi:hypothetical protein